MIYGHGNELCQCAEFSDSKSINYDSSVKKSHSPNYIFHRAADCLPLDRFKFLFNGKEKCVPLVDGLFSYHSLTKVLA
jgi:hypothetical protein